MKCRRTLLSFFMDDFADFWFDFSLVNNGTFDFSFFFTKHTWTSLAYIKKARFVNINSF